MHCAYANVETAHPSLAQRWHAMQPSVSHVCGRGRARARSMPPASNAPARPPGGKVSTDSGSRDRRQVSFGRAIVIGSHDHHAYGTAAHDHAQWKLGKTENLSAPRSPRHPTIVPPSHPTLDLWPAR